MKQFRTMAQAMFNKMADTGQLFRSSLTGRELWEIYLTSFQNDPVFRDPSSSVHNCNTCSSFFRRYAPVVAIGPNNELMTMFDFSPENLDDEREEYEPALHALKTALHAAPIAGVFVETSAELNAMGVRFRKNSATQQFGVKTNYKLYSAEEAAVFGVVKAGEHRTFEHLAIDCPTGLIQDTIKSIESIAGEARSTFDVFERGLREITEDTLKLVLDLINDDSILNGAPHKEKVLSFLVMKQEYSGLPQNQRVNWCWKTAGTYKFARFRNELIGTLCVELSEGKDLEDAVNAWNYRADPANYKKTTAVVTTKMKEQAIAFITNNGYVDSFDREIAKLKDVSPAQILHYNSAGKVAVTKFADIPVQSSQHKRAEFSGVAEVPIDKFLTDILPTVGSMQVYLEPRLADNFVTLTKPKLTDVKSPFGWEGNAFAWTYRNDLTGKSMIAQNVKKAGGEINGDFRFSIQWNEDGRSIVDLDAHLKTPEGEIYYQNYRLPETTKSGGFLDIDMIRPTGIGVENIVYPNKTAMKPGLYKAFVHNYDGRSNTGFKAEIKIMGQSYLYEYVGNAQNHVAVADVTYDSQGNFSIVHHLKVTESNAPVYGLEMNKFHNVNLFCLSPNHWGDNRVGNKHYFMFLEGAKPDEPIRGFHAEFLNQELLNQRRFLEIVAGMTKIEPAPGLSGLGFNSTLRDSVICKLGGSFKRTVKIIF